MNLASNIKNLQGPILVIGASGFVGANILKKLLLYRSDVYGVIKTPDNWRIREVTNENIFIADMTSSADIEKLLSTINPNTIFDCIAYGGYSFQNDVKKIYDVNFNSLVTLVGFLEKKSISAYIHAGSSSEYGDNCSAPLEDDFCEPNSHYSVSKIAAANFLRYMGKKHNFPCLNLRLYSVYGPLEDPSRLIPTLLTLANQGKYPPFVNSKISRDFIHVDDVCSAFINAALNLSPTIYGDSFNIGTEIKTTIEELALITGEIFNIQTSPEFNSMGNRSWDNSDWFANTEKAKKYLNWSSTINLKDGLKCTSEWMLNNSLTFPIASIDMGIHKRSIAAIIACYKDEQAIPIMYQRLKSIFEKLGIEYEIIFVNDCSPDNSLEIIRSISKHDSNVLGINHSRNFGSQMAFRSGMEMSSKDAVVLLDGDLQDPPELIESFVELWEKGYDVIYGVRVKREMPWFRDLMYKSFYRIFAKFSFIKIPLDAGDFSLIDKKVVNWMLSFPERDLFMRGIRAYVGFKQIGVDYKRPERMFGVTTNSFIKNLDWAKKGLFSFSNVPLAILTYAGTVLFISSILMVFVVALMRLVIPDIAPRGITTLLISILLFGSLNLLAIGIVGEYVAKILTETKGRPRLIRASIIRSGSIAPCINSENIQENS